LETTVEQKEGFFLPQVVVRYSRTIARDFQLTTEQGSKRRRLIIMDYLINNGLCAITEDRNQLLRQLKN
jgi:hypothetical protein